MPCISILLLLCVLSEVKCRSSQQGIPEEGHYVSENEIRKLETLLHSMADDTFGPVNQATHLYYPQHTLTEEDGRDKPVETNNGSEKPSETTKVDPWSLVWYVGSFGGLVIFFLAVSCSECCCKKRIQSSNSNVSAENPANISATSNNSSVPWLDEPPPPSYENFAPPAYDSLFYGIKDEKSNMEIFVVPVHHATSLSPPHPPT